MIVIIIIGSHTFIGYNCGSSSVKKITVIIVLIIVSSWVAVGDSWYEPRGKRRTHLYYTKREKREIHKMNIQINGSKIIIERLARYIN